MIASVFLVPAQVGFLKLTQIAKQLNHTTTHKSQQLAFLKLWSQLNVLVWNVCLASVTSHLSYVEGWGWVKLHFLKENISMEFISNIGQPGVCQCWSSRLPGSWGKVGRFLLPPDIGPRWKLILDPGERYWTQVTQLILDPGERFHWQQITPGLPAGSRWWKGPGWWRLPREQKTSVCGAGRGRGTPPGTRGTPPEPLLGAFFVIFFNFCFERYRETSWAIIGCMVQMLGAWWRWNTKRWNHYWLKLARESVDGLRLEGGILSELE